MEAEVPRWRMEGAGLMGIGSAERETLFKLHENSGSWDTTQHPLWENRHWTERLLLSLAKKEMVTDHGDGSFTITQDGANVASQMSRPEPVLRPVSRAPYVPPAVHSRGRPPRYDFGRVLG